METVTLGLVFKVQPEHFQGGTDDMKLKCLASISSVYWKTNEESIEGEKQHRPPVLGVKGSGGNDLDNDASRADRVQGEFSAKIFNFISKSLARKISSTSRECSASPFINGKNLFVVFLFLASNGCKRCSWSLIMNLLSLQFLVVPIIAIR